jgi:hypothetical protein
MAELWYYTSDGKQMEPVTEPELQRLAASGVLKPSDLVWTEGMPQWIRASTADGLFPDARLHRGNADWPVAENPDTDQADTATGQQEPRRRRSPSVYDDDDDDFDPHLRRRSRRLSTGTKIALICGGIGAVLVGGMFVAIVVFLMEEGGNTRSFNLGIGERMTCNIHLNGGRIVEMWVKSTGMSDVDLMVFDPRNPNVPIASDLGPESDCYVRFVAPTTQNYTVVVVNVDNPPVFGRRNAPNSGTLTFRESGPIAGQAVPPGPPARKRGLRPRPGLQRPIVQVPPNVPVPQLPETIHFKAQDQLTRNDPIDAARNLNSRRKTYTVNMTAGVNYTIVLESQQFDSYLRLEDDKGIELRKNDDGIPGTLHSRIDFTPERTGDYRVVATSLGPATGTFTLTVRR